MRSVEVSAPTREEAIAQALKQLKVERDEATVEVINPGSKGLFGLGASPCVLRVTVESSDEEEQHEEPAEQDNDARQSRGEERQSSRNRRGRRGGRGRRGSGERGEQRKEAREERPERNPLPQRAEKRDEPREPKPYTEESKHRDSEAAALLQEIVTRMGIQAKVDVRRADEGYSVLDVESPDSAILIGRKGRNLSAMQYLINRMTKRGENGEDDRLVVDVEGYVGRRQTALEEMAAQMAEKAKRSGRRVKVKPLDPHERRIIHVTLQNDPEVRTFSVGDAPIKSVIIAPKNEQRGDRGGRPPRRRGRRGGSGRGRNSSQRGGRRDNDRRDDGRRDAQPAESNTNDEVA
jgi:spoIIIJ-associated protein